MLGANGTKIFSSTVWKENGSKARIDIENPSPGKKTWPDSLSGSK